MISKAVAKYAKVSPRKTRLVLDLIKDKPVDEAIGILNATNKKASGLLVKLLKSAIANAKRFPNMKQEDLYISKIYADGGPASKRFRAEALGRASVLRKPTSHITIILDIKKTKGKPALQKNIAKTSDKSVLAKASKKKQEKQKKEKNKKER